MAKRKIIKIAIIICLIFIGFLTFCFFGGGKRKAIIEELGKTDNSLSFKLATLHAPFEERDSQSTFVFKDKLWVVGGLDGNMCVYNKTPLDFMADYLRKIVNGKEINEDTYYVNYNEANYFNDIWVSSDGINWTNEGNTPWPGSRSISIIDFNNKLIALGGFSLEEGNQKDIWSSSDGINWIDQGPAPWQEREGQQVLIFNDKLWMFGGVNYTTNKTYNDIWSSIDGVNWTNEGNASWSSRWDHAMTVFADKIFMSGGMDLQGNVFNDIWSSIDGVNWSLVSENSVWDKRQGHALLDFNNKLWLIGKLFGENDVWVSIDGITWEKFNEKIPWVGREDFGAAVFKDKIWILAGMDSNYRWRNDIWSLEEK